MKIIIVNYLSLSELPPAKTLINYLQLNHDLIYISLYEERFERNNQCVKIFSLYHRKIVHSGDNTVKEKFLYKFERLLHKRARKKVWEIIERYYNETTKLWILHESTINALGKKIFNYKYNVTLYELDSVQFSESKFLKKVCMRAENVIVPEETRAYLVKTFFQLDKKPSIIHNKPLDTGIDNCREEIEIDSEIIKLFEEAHSLSKRIFLYAGIFIPERRLDSIIEAFDRFKEEAILVLMGRESWYLKELQKKYKDKFYYIGFFESPYHLQLIKMADVGILSYVPTGSSLNALFCAPNKIFEYGKYGLPMLGNDIPGLKFLIEGNRMGKCFDIEKKEEIVLAIEKLIEYYNLYKENSRKYFESVNINQEIDSVI